MNYWVNYSFYSLSSPQTKLKFMKKHWSWTTTSTSHEQMTIMYNSFGVLQSNKLLLLGQIRWYPGFNHWLFPSPRKGWVKKLTDFFKICNHLPNVFYCFKLKNLYCGAIMFGFHRSGQIYISLNTNCIHKLHHCSQLQSIYTQLYKTVR